MRALKSIQTQAAFNPRMRKVVPDVEGQFLKLKSLQSKMMFTISVASAANVAPGPWTLSWCR